MVGQETKIVFLGAGNLATAMATVLSACPVEIIQVYSRTELSAKTLAKQAGCGYTYRISDVRQDADLYIVAIPDHCLPDFSKEISLPDKLLVHTSAATSMEVLSAATQRYGIFYPLQTFTKGRVPDMKNVPFFLEAHHADDLALLKQVALLVSPNVYEVGLETRSRIHLAAAFVCNFTNYLYSVGEDILQEDGLPFQLLYPLMQETLTKIGDKSPKNTQTGPAVRGDVKTLKTHLALMRQHSDWQEIYKLISERINPDLSF